jgi:NTE family protein
MKNNLSNGASHPRVGLALSGGASRGIAHIGVIQALIDNGIKIDFLSGTSIGAMVGALYAFGIPIEDIHRRAREMSWLSISSVKISKTALLSNRVIGEIIEDFLEDANIEDALIPLAIVTTDISRGKKVILHSGNVSRAVMASTAIPGIFSPIYIDGRLLVDGFLVDNVPVSILKEMGADVTIGVNLGTLKEYREPKGIINIIMNAFDIAIDANTSLTSQDADVLIVPKLSEIELNDSMRSTVLYDEGYSAALFSLSKIKNVIQDKQRKTRKSFWRML